MRGRALDHALKAERLLGRGVGVARQVLHLFVEETLELALERRDVAAAVAYDFGDVCIVEQCVEHVLDAEELVVSSASFADGKGEGDDSMRMISRVAGCGPTTR